MTDKPKADYYTGPQAGDFAAAADPFALFEAWFEDAKAHEPNDPNAMALATVDAGGMPNVRMVLLKGVDGEGAPTAASCSTPTSRAPRDASCWPSEGGAVLPLEVAAPAGARARPRLAGERRRGRRLLRHPRPRQPARRLGLAAVAPAREPLRAGEGRGRRDGPISDRRHPAPALLVGLPHHAARDGVLARPPLPPARARRLPARAARARRGPGSGSILDHAGATPLPWGRVGMGCG